MIICKFYNIIIPMLQSNSDKMSPWWWVPTLYFAEGIPYFIVNVISVIMFKNMGLGNAEIALYTSILYLPWVIKPLWSPFVDIIKTKRWWVISMQAVMTATFVLLAVCLPRKSENIDISAFTLTLIIFYITAFASATHDIAADGYYMLALDPHKASMFVGIRSTFYRIASVFGQGVLVVMAGLLEKHFGDIPKAWSVTMVICAVIFGVITLYHVFRMPSALQDTPRKEKSARDILRETGRTFVTFFRKKQVWIAMLFMLLYRLPEALSVKMLNPFLLDSAEAGGLALSTESVGLVYGTVGVIALTVGGILGGLAAAKWGLKKSLWPMALSLALPCGVYLYMAAALPQSLLAICICVAFDQFGYGFGFTAYMLYMMYFSEGEFKTSHYSLCTAFMALSMMLPGLFAGKLQESIGYVGFFIVVMICCLATVAVTMFVKVDPQYGKKNV